MSCLQILGRSLFFKFSETDTSSRENGLTSSTSLDTDTACNHNYHIQDQTCVSGFRWMTDISQSTVSVMLVDILWMSNRVCNINVLYLFTYRTSFFLNNFRFNFQIMIQVYVPYVLWCCLPKTFINVLSFCVLMIHSCTINYWNYYSVNFEAIALQLIFCCSVQHHLMWAIYYNIRTQLKWIWYTVHFLTCIYSSDPVFAGNMFQDLP
jgi:hypothetical protein